MNLKVLDLYSTYISNDHIELLVRNCTELSDLYLYCCASLTDQAFEYLKECKHLKYLGIVNCYGITAKAINALKIKNPKLTLHDFCM